MLFFKKNFSFYYILVDESKEGKQTYAVALREQYDLSLTKLNALIGKKCFLDSTFLN